LDLEFGFEFMTERAPQSHPTIGVLSGWGMYEMKLHSYFSDLLRGIRMAARHHECNLLIGGSLLHRATASNQVTAWGGWMMSPDESYLPIGPWNTDGCHTSLFRGARRVFA
jgi:hypothetical protein